MKRIFKTLAVAAVIGGASLTSIAISHTAHAASAPAAVESGTRFVELTPFILPIIDPDGASQVVTMVIAVEVNTAEAAAEVKRLSPRLKDAYLQDMYGALNRHAALRGGQIRLGVIKKRLNMASTRVLGEDVVQDVLLQVVQQRPI